MSYQRQWKQLLDRSAVSSNAKLTGRVLLDFADADGKGARPGAVRLEKTTGLSEAAIRRAIRELETSGLVVTAARSRVAGEATEYRLTLASGIRTTSEFEDDISATQAARRRGFRGKALPVCETGRQPETDGLLSMAYPSESTCKYPSVRRVDTAVAQLADQALSSSTRLTEPPPTTAPVVRDEIEPEAWPVPVAVPFAAAQGDEEETGPVDISVEIDTSPVLVAPERSERGRTSTEKTAARPIERPTIQPAVLVSPGRTKVSSVGGVVLTERLAVISTPKGRERAPVVLTDDRPKVVGHRFVPSRQTPSVCGAYDERRGEDCGMPKGSKLWHPNG